MDAAEKLLLSVQQKHVLFFTLLLAQVPRDVKSGKVFLTCFSFLDAVSFVVIEELFEFLC
jgi:hypothetical protein